MSEEKFTQGEWTFNPAKSIYRATISANGNIIAVFADPPTEINARLIESAPKMYEKLCELNRLLLSLGSEVWDVVDLGAVSNDIENLLAKARGEL